MKKFLLALAVSLVVLAMFAVANVKAEGFCIDPAQCQITPDPRTPVPADYSALKNMLHKRSDVNSDECLSGIYDDDGECVVIEPGEPRVECLDPEAANSYIPEVWETDIVNGACIYMHCTFYGTDIWDECVETSKANSWYNEYFACVVANGYSTDCNSSGGGGDPSETEPETQLFGRASWVYQGPRIPKPLFIEPANVR
jgi:hypothetical protein